MRNVLQTLVFKENSVQTKDGSWYRMKIVPYRTADNVIDGVVITFTDITDIKNMTERLEERLSTQRASFALSGNRLWS